MLEWDDLRYFLAIARHGTLSGAARALGVQQSTMGRRLEAFEQRAGVQLLQRTPAGFVLTAAGEAILPTVERIESEALAVERTVTGKDVRLEGTVKLTCTDNLAVGILVPLLGDFAKLCPGIALELIADYRSLSLTRREADIALRMSKFTQQGVFVRKMADIAVGIYASRDYLERHGPIDFSLGAAGHRILLPVDEQMEAQDVAWFADLACHATVAFRSNTRTALLAAAKAGMGVVCLSRYLGDPADLVLLETAGKGPSRELWLGVHDDIRHMPRIRAVTDFLAAALKQKAAQLDPPSRAPASPARGAGT